MWVYECVFATLVECFLIDKSNEFFFRARVLVKTHTSRIITRFGISFVSTDRANDMFIDQR